MAQGLLLIAAASALLACNTTMAKFAYMGGLTAPGLLLVRYLAGAALFTAHLKWRRLPICPPGALRRTIGAGLLVLMVSLLFLGAVARPGDRCAADPRGRPAGRLPAPAGRQGRYPVKKPKRLRQICWRSRFVHAGPLTGADW